MSADPYTLSLQHFGRDLPSYIDSANPDDSRMTQAVKGLVDWAGVDLDAQYQLQVTRSESGVSVELAVVPDAPRYVAPDFWAQAPEEHQAAIDASQATAAPVTEATL